MTGFNLKKKTELKKSTDTNLSNMKDILVIIIMSHKETKRVSEQPGDLWTHTACKNDS